MAGIRNFITELENRNLLCRVENEVNWKYELGAVARKKNVPLLFENIKDYPNKKVLVNGLSTHASIAVALGVTEDSVKPKKVSGMIREALNKPVEPVIVEDSPVLENKITEDIDLSILPIPWWSEIDAGRYVGTWHLNISRDPDTGVRNVGVYRMQLLGPSQTTVSISPRSHLAAHLRKAEKRGMNLPMAVAIGVDERLIICAAAAPPYGLDELALAGGLIGKPVELFRCRTQPLEVPVESEIVIEGYIKPGTRVQDGPFLDYAGIPSTNPGAYLFEATGLFFRDNYIYRGTAVGNPGAEDHQLYSILAGAGLADFHGSRLRHLAQTFFLKHRAYKLLQYSGRVGAFLKKDKSDSPVRLK